MSIGQYINFTPTKPIYKLPKLEKHIAYVKVFHTTYIWQRPL